MNANQRKSPIPMIVVILTMALVLPGLRLSTDAFRADGALALARQVQEASTPVDRGSSEELELLRATESERLRALVEEDIATAERLHTDDFQLINPFGETLDKDQYLGAIASGAIDYLVFEPTSEIAVRTYGDAAVVRYQSRIEIIVDGQRLSDRGWHTDVYERTDDGWRAVWSQMTRITPR